MNRLPEREASGADTNQSAPNNYDSILNHWLEQFEQTWEPTGQALARIAKEAGFDADPIALSELVRVDIDRHYQIESDVELTQYFARWPGLWKHRQAAMEIAFEDFRARRSRGLSFSSARWSWIPGISTQPWYIELKKEEKTSPAVEACDEPQPGQVFGAFTIVCQLGAGAFSRVYLATQGEVGSRYVALKVTRRWLSEPQNLGLLQHTGIVPLYSIHRIGLYYVLCMPYHGAATLADWLQSNGTSERSNTRSSQSRVSNQPSTSSKQRQAATVRNGQSLIETVEARQAVLQEIVEDENPASVMPAQPTSANRGSTLTPQPLNRKGAAMSASARSLLNKLQALDAGQLSLWLAARLSAALAHAHARGVVHGDIKPANILIRNDGEPALIDFNLSRLNSQDEFRYVGGTLPYMAPEQLQALMGREVSLSPAADVYSLGLVLFESIAGQPAFAAPCTMAECDLQAAVEARKNARIDFRSTRIPAGYRAIIEKCLQFEPSRRYASAVELQADVDAQVQHRPLVHAKESWASRAGKITRRYPRAFSSSAVASVSLVVCSVLAFLGWSSWQRAQRFGATQAMTTHIQQLKTDIVSLIDTRNPESLPGTLRQVAFKDDNRADQLQLRGLQSQDLVTLRRAEYEACLTALVLMLEKPGPTTFKSETVAGLVSACGRYPEFAGQSKLFTTLTEALTRSELHEIGKQLDAPHGIMNLPDTERLLVARILLIQGRAADALEIVNSIKPLEVHTTLFWLTAGASQLKLGQSESAQLSFSFAIQDRPESHTAYYQRAFAEMAKSSWDAARQDHDRAIELSQQRDGSYFAQRALVFERLGLPEPALADIQRALDLGVESTRLLFIKARLHNLAGDPVQAKECQHAALTQPPVTVEDWISRALHRAKNAPEEAVEDLRQALSIEPRSVSALQNLAFVQSEYLNDDRAALESLNRLLEIQPDHQEGRGGRCVLLARLDSFEAAQADIRYIRQNFSQPLPVTVYQVGSAYSQLARQQPALKKQALNFLMRALQQGYGLNLLATDTDLDPLRQDAEFTQLVELSKLIRR